MSSKKRVNVDQLLCIGLLCLYLGLSVYALVTLDGGAIVSVFLIAGAIVFLVMRDSEDFFSV